MNITLGSEFEKDMLKQQQLDLLRQEVAKGFEQLFAGEHSPKSALDIFDEVSGKD